jgi:hypothetical protein
MGSAHPAGSVTLVPLNFAHGLRTRADIMSTPPCTMSPVVRSAMSGRSTQPAGWPNDEAPILLKDRRHDPRKDRGRTLRIALLATAERAGHDGVNDVTMQFIQHTCAPAQSPSNSITPIFPPFSCARRRYRLYHHPELSCTIT